MRRSIRRSPHSKQKVIVCQQKNNQKYPGIRDVEGSDEGSGMHRSPSTRLTGRKLEAVAARRLVPSSIPVFHHSICLPGGGLDIWTISRGRLDGHQLRRLPRHGLLRTEQGLLTDALCEMRKGLNERQE